MFSKFDPTTLAIIEKASEYSRQYFKLSKVGTEAFLYIMFSDEDSLCRILLEEYRVSLAEINDLMKEIVIIRSKSDDYTVKLKEVFQTALTIAKDNGNGIVYEEHLFFALLLVKNSIFISELEKLNLNAQTLLEDVKDYFNLKDGKELDNYSINLTSLAREGKLNRLIGREEYLKRMAIILSRKNKNNILLVGSAGVGKTALVEGLAEKFINEDCEIIAINVSSIIANTKYRGDFESRINRILEEVIKDNTILFIDEIHTIMGAGSTDNSLDLANILKPYLARGNFRCIGATTIEEYHQTIIKDKALARRFQPVFINEPTKMETKVILEGIYKDFVDFHKVEIAQYLLDYIVSLSERITNRKFPDKAIDLLDESLSVAKMENKSQLTVNEIDQAFANISGLTKGIINYNYVYSELEAYYLDNYLGDDVRNNLVTISFNGDEDNLKVLLEELSMGFGINKEMILDLDLTNFTESHSVASLFGAPNGYVGYDEGGIISEHFAKFPAQIVIIRNLSLAHSEIQAIINRMLKETKIYDKKGREILTNKAAFVFVDNTYQENRRMGFISQGNEEKTKYDLQLGNKINNQKSFFNILEKRGYHVEVNEEDYLCNTLAYKRLFFELLNHYSIGHYQLKYNENSKEIDIIQV